MPSLPLGQRESFQIKPFSNLKHSSFDSLEQWRMELRPMQLPINDVNNEYILEDTFHVEFNQVYENLPVGEAQLGLHFETKPFPRQINSKDKSKLNEKSTSLKIISEPQWTSLRLTRTLTCKCGMMVYTAKEMYHKDQLRFCR